MKLLRIGAPMLAITLLTSLTFAEDPYLLLKPAIDEGFDFTGSMVVQVEGWEEDPMMLQMFTLKDKGAKLVWIHPSTMQGQMFLDDGKAVQQYFPDQRVIRIRPSFHTFWPSISYQLDLVRKNYVVKIVGESTRLGRPVTELSVTAKSAELGIRTLMIDKKLPVVLEDSHRVGANSIYRLRTLNMQELQASQIKLKLDVSGEVVRRETWGPKKVTDIKIAAGAIGFTPQIPNALPFGFQVFAKQLVGLESDPFFVARISDGMLIGHIYEWKFKSGEAKSKLDIQAMLVDKNRDIAYSILGDIPPEAAKRVLKAFSENRE